MRKGRKKVETTVQGPCCFSAVPVTWRGQDLAQSVSQETGHLKVMAKVCGVQKHKDTVMAFAESWKQTQWVTLCL